MSVSTETETGTGTGTSAPSIRARHPRFPLGPEVPRHWMLDRAVATHIANGVCMLFPAGERFFVRSVRRYAEQIDDPALKDLVRGFYGQEGAHARAHEDCFDMLEAQGFQVRPFLRQYEHILRNILEANTPPVVRLSATVALEHYTAIMAENALRDGLIQRAHPAMRDLLLWHAAEEIEHKSVAFEVLQRVDPRYSVRVAGLVMATLGLLGFWVAASTMLIRQDRDIAPGQVWRELRESNREHPIGKRVILRGIREFLRRDFHPWNNDNGHLAQEYLASVGLG